MVATALRLNRSSEGRPGDNRPILLGQSAAMAEMALAAQDLSVMSEDLLTTVRRFRLAGEEAA